MTNEQGQKLIKIAREALKNSFISSLKPSPITEFSERAATFVTLTKDGQLRGCVGCLEAFESIGQNVVRNVLAAAFQDHRFQPVLASELKEIKIEISILTPSEEINYRDSEDLLTKITPGLDGITILSNDQKSATFLPQVWEDLSDKEVFLSALCEKAGLPANTWRDQKIKVYKYRVQSFLEN